MRREQIKQLPDHFPLGSIPKDGTKEQFAAQDSFRHQLWAIWATCSMFHLLPPECSSGALQKIIKTSSDTPAGTSHPALSI
jgi:hypothetical protein